MFRQLKLRIPGGRRGSQSRLGCQEFQGPHPSPPCPSPEAGSPSSFLGSRHPRHSSWRLVPVAALEIRGTGPPTTKCVLSLRWPAREECDCSLLPVSSFYLDLLPSFSGSASVSLDHGWYAVENYIKTWVLCLWVNFRSKILRYPSLACKFIFWIKTSAGMYNFGSHKAADSRPGLSRW